MKFSATIETGSYVSSGFWRDLNYLVISDIHLLHKRTPTSFIIANLDAFFENYASTSAFAKLDVIFIAGDLFETLDSINENIVTVVGWFYRLFDFCQTNNIKLRVLEGTPSHDAKQARLMVPIANTYTGGLDFKYISKLEIEYIEDLKLSVLYVPDEWLGSTHKAQQEIEALMDSMSTTQVDIAIMHGLFSFQVPEQKKPNLKYDETFFLNRVRYFINIGHDHTPKVYSRIIVQGSFDRLAQNEEHPKGCCWCYLRTDGQHGFALLENKRAKIYKTLKVANADNLEKALAFVRKRLDTIAPESYVQIRARTGHPILQSLEQLKKEYLFLHLSRDAVNDDGEPVKKGFSDLLSTPDYVPLSLTKDNIVDRIMTQLEDKGEIKQDKDHLKTMLEKLS